MKERLLTKSRFKLGMECPTKLFYTAKPQYANQSLEDSFLAALAQGGYQVGELAKCYFPDGINIASLDTDKALRETEQYLKRENVTLFEPAIRFQNFLVRVDILVKRGNEVEIIEVKAKSFHPGEDSFFTKRGNKGLVSAWRPYLEDVAFQHHVITQAYPEFSIKPFLMLADKSCTAETDGLNTHFRVKENTAGRLITEVSKQLSEHDLATPLLCKIDVQEEVNFLLNEQRYGAKTFAQQARFLSEAYERDLRESGPLGKHCKVCEFTCNATDEKAGKISGFKECWKSTLGWNDKDFDDKTVLDIAAYTKKDSMIEQGRIKLVDLDEGDFDLSNKGKKGLSRGQRQWLQVKKVQGSDSTPYIDTSALRTEIQNWTYPLHFIDFETTACALPFTQGLSPYEGVAFQFSHHIVHADGTVEHATQYLNTTPGEFPSFDFVRALKNALDGDKGTIFRYSPHENTYLNLIEDQLIRSSSVSETETRELVGFIHSVTYKKQGQNEVRRGDRCMVDLLDLVKNYYYSPLTNGSNSIKHVLPAVLQESDYLKNKYSKPIYGATDGITSSNFSDWVWLKTDGGKIVDPYKQLPALFTDVPDEVIDLLSDDDSLANGGAALTAYAKLQFTQMSDYERKELNSALLKYCELDTLAMVMIYEYWNNLINNTVI